MKISLCMIAKNEEKVVGRAIDSCKGVVDEIILVDTGSEDRTVEIAKAKGAKVYFFAWKNDFAAAKNYALSKAKGDWIVFLDADEYFGNGTEKNLRGLLRKIETQYDAIATYMINFDLHDGKQLDTMVQMRIFKNDKNIRYTSPIHEVLHHFKQGNKINALMLKEKELVLFHTGYSAGEREGKARRNLKVLLEEMKKENASPSYYIYLSDCYFSLKEWEKAIEHARKFLESGVEMIGYGTRPYQNIIEAMGKLNYSPDDIVKEVKMAIAKFPRHPQFQFYMAIYEMGQKKYDAALLCLNNALEFHENYSEIEINCLVVNLWYVYNALGANYELRGEVDRAIQYYQMALQRDWNNDQCCMRLLRLLQYKPLEEATRILDSIFDVDDDAGFDFLLARLVNAANPQVLAHYVIIRQKKYPKNDFIILQMLLANKYYSKVVPALLECIRIDADARLAIVTAAAIMLSEDNAHYEEISLLPIALQKIVKAFQGQTKDLEGVSPQVLVELVHIFLLWGKSSQTEKILSLRHLFSQELTVDLAHLLMERGHFQAACEVYRKLLQEYMVGGFVYYNLAYCLHQQGKPEEAVECLIQAYDKGYRENDLYEVLRWNVEKLSENEKELKKCALEILKKAGAEYE